MSRFRRREAPVPDDADRRTLDAAVAALRNCQRAGVTTVTVADMLVMLGAAPETAPAPQEPPRRPDSDPLTGCAPVTAPGKG